MIAPRPARSTSRSSTTGPIGRVRGAKDNSYTAGVICAKVARYAERIHHPDRLLKPLLRAGAKGEGALEGDRLGRGARRDRRAVPRGRGAPRIGDGLALPLCRHHGLVQRDGIHRLRHAKRYSRQFDTICTKLAWTGYIAGTGRLRGPDPREMAKSDCVVIWGTNAVDTQVNVMTHAMRARKERGAKIVVIDIYDNATDEAGRHGPVLRPGTDGALACAVMHVLFRDGLADRDYLARYTDDPAGAGSAPGDPDAGMGGRDHRPGRRRDRGLRPARRHDEAHLFPPRLRLHPPAQRRHQHARGACRSPP